MKGLILEGSRCRLGVLLLVEGSCFSSRGVASRQGSSVMKDEFDTNIWKTKQDLQQKDLDRDLQKGSPKKIFQKDLQNRSPQKKFEFYFSFRGH